MRVVIAKVDEVFFDGQADSVSVPASAGEMTVLAGHMPLITTLKKGSVVVRADYLPGGEQTFRVEDGVLEVRTDGVVVIL